MRTTLHERKAVWLALVAMGLAALLAGCGSSSGGSSPSPSPSPAVVTQQQVIDLVAVTGAALGKDVQTTLSAIDAREAPYIDPANPDFYSYVTDMKLTVLAHPDSTVVGQNNVGKPDPTGHLYRDEILKGVTTTGSGWVRYVYLKPDAQTLFVKDAYYKVFTGADGKQYVVIGARYLGPWSSPAPSSSPTT
jgi:hypothetical protein